jgi:hypothetical protein
MAKASSVPVIRIPLTPYPGITTANWQTAEATIATIGSVGVNNLVHSLLLNVTGLAGNLTTRLYTNINGVQVQSYSQVFSLAVDGPGLWIINGTLAIHGTLLVTAQSDNVADNGLAIGWEYILGGT